MTAEAAHRRFSVIVVGSGPAGVSAAWPLVEAGIDVLMIDGAEPVQAPPPVTGTIGALRGSPSQWRHRFGGDLGGVVAPGDVSPKLATPLARALTGGYAAAVGLGTRDFVAAGSLSAGGLSNIWGAVAETYDAADLAGYPIGLDELGPSYRAVMARAGIVEAGWAVPEEAGFRSPVQEVFRRSQGVSHGDGFELKRARNAVLQAPLDGREACSYCGLCLWGCARRSIYNSADELPALERRPNFTYMPRTRALALSGADDLQGLSVLQDGTVMTLMASRIILAAGTIATTALVLRRLGLFETPVRLLGNPVGAMAFVVPKLVGQALPDRSFSLGQLRYRVAIAGGPDHAGGVLYGADTLPLGTIADRIPLSRPVALRLARALMPALVLATCYLPGRFSSNSLRLTQGSDGGVEITGEMTAAAQRAMKNAARGLAARMRRFGAYAIPGSFTAAPPGSDAHYAGTLPMGGIGDAACGADGTLNGCPGITIADGAALPGLPARHCTLTIMANADRIARGLVPKLLQEAGLRQAPGLRQAG